MSIAMGNQEGQSKGVVGLWCFLEELIKMCRNPIVCSLREILRILTRLGAWTPGAEGGALWSWKRKDDGKSVQETIP